MDDHFGTEATMVTLGSPILRTLDVLPFSYLYIYIFICLFIIASIVILMGYVPSYNDKLSDQP